MNNNEKKIYTPIVPIPPGETLAELLEVLNMSQKELAERMGRPLKLINEIIKGKASITPETAIQLERVFASYSKDASFWTNLEAGYQEALARCEAEVNLEEEQEKAKNYPYSEMVKNGWVPPAKGLEMVKNLLEYFGVSSLDNIVENKLLEPVLFRVSEKKKIDNFALATWLRKGAIDALKIESAPFNETKLKEKIEDLRKLILEEDPNIVVEKIRNHLAEAGVSFVVTKNLTNVPVNGASRWIGPDKAIIQLSIYGSYADKFWFSLFHEIGHLLLHGKKSLNIDTKGQSQTDVKEAEANEFASNILIPKDNYFKFIKTTAVTLQTISDFAKELKIRPGIVVGRLQIDGRIGFHQFNSLRNKYTWETK